MLQPALNKLQSVKMWHGEKLQPWSHRAGKRDRFSPLESPQEKKTFVVQRKYPVVLTRRKTCLQMKYELQLGGGFKMFFIFTPTWGRLAHIFQMGGLRPPTRQGFYISVCFPGGFGQLILLK